MLSFDIHRIFGLAKAMVKGNHLHTNLYSQLAVVLGQPVAEGLLELKQINCMGDIYVRQKYWEESLEVGFIRSCFNFSWVILHTNIIHFKYNIYICICCIGYSDSNIRIVTRYGVIPSYYCRSYDRFKYNRRHHLLNPSAIHS